MSSLAISKLKGLLQEQVSKQYEAGESGSSAAVIEAVWKNHPEAVKTAAIEYANAMMARLLSQLANHCPNEQQQAQPDLFEGYSGLHQFIAIPVERDGKTEVEWIPLPKVALGQLAGWLADDHRTETTRRQREPGMAKLLRDLSGAAQGRKDITVEEALKLRRARGGK
jgi:hypothetical protein